MKTPLGIRLGRIVVAIVRPIAFVLFPYKMIGKENIPQTDGPMIVCCNHISMIDPVYMLLAFRRPIFFMAKDELFKNPVLAFIFKHLFGVFPVNRGHGDTGAVATSLSILENGQLLGIFPEGTRSKTGKLGPAKSGTVLIAAKAQVPIYPCAIFSKSGQVKLFQRTTIVFGKTLTTEELGLHTEKPDLRFASRKLMSVIAQMIEENQHEC